MSEQDMTKRPDPNMGDCAHMVIRAGLSAIPGAAELFSWVITPSLERRRDEWIESIAVALKVLEEKLENFSVKGLDENEAFVSEPPELKNESQ